MTELEILVDSSFMENCGTASLMGALIKKYGPEGVGRLSGKTVQPEVSSAGTRSWEDGRERVLDHAGLRGGLPGEGRLEPQGSRGSCGGSPGLAVPRYFLCVPCAVLQPPTTRQLITHAVMLGSFDLCGHGHQETSVRGSATVLGYPHGTKEAGSQETVPGAQAPTPQAPGLEEKGAR